MKEKNILFFDVKLKERIWGGYELAKEFKIEENKKIGEAWILSGHKHGASIIQNGYFSGQSLDMLYRNHKELFGDSDYKEFPLLIKVLDAQDDLSVQVHPDDSYALKHHNDFGKNECWYILNSSEDARIIYGVNAKSKVEMLEAINHKKWDGVLRRVSVKPGDFFNVPVGTVHAIGKGIQILEVQQSSDVTYRLYDYDRIDNEGNKRELHIEPALEVMSYDAGNIKNEYLTYKNVIRLVENKYFTVDRVELEDAMKISQINTYSIIYVQDGQMEISFETGDKQIVSKNQVVLITALSNSFAISGESKFFLIREKKHELEKTYL